MGRPYFAYGSNMDREQMAARCRGCEPLGTARLAHHRFLINLRGVATVVPDEQATVHGVLWDLEGRHEQALDRYEGVAAGLYRKKLATVTRADDTPVDAVVYLAADVETGRPRRDYQELVLAAAERERLPEAYLDELRGWLTVPGPSAS